MAYQPVGDERTLAGFFFLFRGVIPDPTPGRRGRLANNPAQDWWPAWSPDGTKQIRGGIGLAIPAAPGNELPS